jgi:hypothetical protein
MLKYEIFRKKIGMMCIVSSIVEKYADEAQADHWIQCAPWNEICS